MTRDEFKNGLNDFIDSLVKVDRELSEEDEQSLIDQFGEVASDVLANEEAETEDVS